ncbi:hypothetical protein C5167_001382 [Papaver somniferum]|uniref:Uncharacterized protein n=1 Tax=Papaver somniferum TaxID=3469 RepID=A0A4Y7KWK5_PAPSO|nr:hypothetical protein C5167_001382 [Papaver somniferum]
MGSSPRVQSCLLKLGGTQKPMKILPAIVVVNREQVNMDIVVEDLPSFLKSFSTLQNLYQLEQHTVGDRKVDPPRRKLNLRISWDSNLSKSEEMSQTCKVFGVILWPPFQRLLIHFSLLPVVLIGSTKDTYDKWDVVVIPEIVVRNFFCSCIQSIAGCKARPRFGGVRQARREVCNFARLGGKLLKGMILTGGLGTGKALLAKTIAVESRRGYANGILCVR